ncbi:cell envelope integrity protein TolA [Alsobacter sp. SYSU M60028]|uniref:Cell envelope integrity protein TolA n=1 Tax=Alsobacter ponti TaxID=2962936 RepID=A0ABT1LE94_9HYPH|nr:cell envelope integrity protein TolA [Alsobacter ponti]
MKFDRSQPGFLVSGVAHFALLAATLVAFSSTAKFEDAQESLAVEIVTADELNQITKGERDAKTPKPDPKPRVDKVADVQETKPNSQDAKRDVPTEAAAEPLPPERPRDLTAEADAKAEAEAKAEADAKAQAAAAAAAKAAEAAKARAEAKAKADAEAKAAEDKAEAEALAKAEAEARAREAKAKADAKAKAEAEAKALAEAKAREAKAKADAEAKAKAEAEAKAKAEEARKLAAEPPKPKAPPKPDAKFDPSQIEKLLTSKEKPQQAPSTGREVNRTASIGTPNATGLKLNPSQKGRLGEYIKDRMRECWNVPAGAAGTPNLKPRLHIEIGRDGAVVGVPTILNASSDPMFMTVAESAVRAVRRCSPFNLPRDLATPETYEDWREWNITFEPEGA